MFAPLHCGNAQAGECRHEFGVNSWAAAPLKTNCVRSICISLGFSRLCDQHRREFFARYQAGCLACCTSMHSSGIPGVVPIDIAAIFSAIANRANSVGLTRILCAASIQALRSSFVTRKLICCVSIFTSLSNAIRKCCFEQGELFIKSHLLLIKRPQHAVHIAFLQPKRYCNFLYTNIWMTLRPFP